MNKLTLPDEGFKVAKYGAIMFVLVALHGMPEGHHAKTCAPPKKRSPPVCTKCRRSGHNARTCDAQMGLF